MQTPILARGTAASTGAPPASWDTSTEVSETPHTMWAVLVAATAVIVDRLIWRVRGG